MMIPRQDRIEVMWQQRAAAAADTTVRGREFCHRLSAATDAWMTELVAAATRDLVDLPRYALVALGGYGRGELAPQSDIDLVVIYEGDRDEIEPFASRLWYPIWDRGVSLGHAVRTLDEQSELAQHDLDTATALLTARPIAGDPDLGAAVIHLARRHWDEHRTTALSALHDRVRDRHATAGEVAYILEPDLKNGNGGIRDAQSLWWAEHAGLELADQDDRDLNECYDVLLATRVALHLSSGHHGDVLRLQEQDSAARLAGYASADELMGELAAAARTIAWIANEMWGRVGRSVGGERERVAPGIVLVDGDIELDGDIPLSTDPMMMIRVATAAARHGARIGRHTLDYLAAAVQPWPGRWPAGAVDQFVAFLLEGHRAIPVAYHRFTVDRHLWETTAIAADLSDRVSRPDLAVLGALFHDLGKGYDGDHSAVGVELIGSIGPRLGLPPRDVEILQAMVRHHLLLPDVAVRRDLSDPVTLRSVADQVGSIEVLQLLHVLTIADSRATGPAAWGEWKAALVDELVDRVSLLFDGGDLREATWTLFPDADTVTRMANGVPAVVITDERIVVVYPDRTGIFSRIAGVMALHGVNVLSARAVSDHGHQHGGGMAAAELRVELPVGVDIARLRAEALWAIDGKVAIEARLAAKVDSYRRRPAVQAATPDPPSVTFHDGASEDATVIEVRATTTIGILYRITRALNDVGLDIRHASVQTVGLEVIDTFYVRDWAGQMITDPTHRSEIERAVLHAVA
ncbi:MAG: [protein-PII] uridylyltransferase [Ilumatobacter coccineus]|uniref:[protein-PII] uridylyltransferase n=1 Tax=Ilumatobacter coccineus TaxID=467094 RepID=A0A2G6K8X6_9ACTN|nr:MAG: [protein-PII] uridylyltransferase [Ilumatobacter coccineus]